MCSLIHSTESRNKVTNSTSGITNAGALLWRLGGGTEQCESAPQSWIHTSAPGTDVGYQEPQQD